jgi:gas vesicle protein
MSDRDNVDVWTAVAIGAVVGIGAALLVRARQEDDTHELIRKLQPLRKRAGRAAKSMKREVRRGAGKAVDAGEELVDAGRDILEELRDGASEIVRNTRDELQKAARESVRDARRAAGRAAKRVR